MATTSLGMTIWSKWIGGGVKEAHREISSLDDRVRKVNSSFLIASGRSSALKTSMLALAPAVKTVAGVMAGTAAAGGAAFLAAGAAAAVYGKVMSDTVKRTNEARAAGKALSEDQQLYIIQVDRLKSAWDRLLKQQEGNTLRTASIAVDGMKHAVERLNPILDATQGIIMRNAEAWRDWTMRDDGMKRFADNVAKYGAPYLNGLLLAGRETLGGLGYLFRAALENSNGLIKSILQGATAFKQWAAGGGFTRFFEWVASNRGSVQAFFDALVAAFKNLTSAVGTLGPIMLNIATVILNFIAAMDPQVIVAFYLALLGLKVIAHITAAVQLLTVAVKLLSGAMQFLYANPIVIAIVAIIAVFVLLWVKVEAFRNFWKAVWDLIVQAAVWAWENGIKPAFNAIADGAMWLWEHGIRPVVNYIVSHWDDWMNAAKWAWDNILWPVIKAIGAAAMWVWNSILKPVIDMIVEHWDGWMQTAQRAWEGILKPVFLALGQMATWIWETILRPVFSFIASHWDDILNAMKWAWDNVLKPVFIVIGEIVKFLWNTVLKVIFEAISFGFRAMVEIIAFIWNNILSPVFSAIGTIVDFLWTFILKPIFFLIGENFKIMVAIIKYIWDSVLQPLWDLFATVVTWLWQNVIQPVFGYIADRWSNTVNAMKAVWETVLKPMWDNLVGAFNWVKEKIGEGIDAIGRFWDGLKEKVKGPVEWIINTVWNNGLVKGWNWINDLWGGTDIQPFNFNAGGGGGGGATNGGGAMKAFATGGPVRGPGTGTSDSITARLSNGEHVWTAAEVRAAGGHGGVAALRSAVMGGAAVRAASSGTNFAEGGFWDGVKDFFTPGKNMAEAVGRAAPSLAGFTGFADGLRGTINGAGGFAENMVGMVKGVGTKALDAVIRFVTDKLMPKFSGGGMNWQMMWDVVRGAFPDATLTSSLRAGAQDFHGSGNAIDVAWPMTEFGKGKMLELNKWIAARYPDSTELIHTPGVNLKNGRPFTYSADTQAAHYNHVHWAMAGGSGPGGVSSSADGWRSLVMQELAHFGQPASLVDTVLRRLQQESGGNANAINNWDINAQNGTPSKGLMQVIDPTFAAYKGGGHPDNIWDPGANMHAAFAYAMSRYGSLSNAFNRPGGYQLGTNGARSGWSWVGERGAELVKFRGGEKVLNEERLRRMSGAVRGADRPLVDTGGAPLIDARGATKEAVDKLDKDTLPKLNQMLKQLRG